MTDVFLHAMQAGLRVYGLEFPGCGYYDIGSPANLLRARQRFETGHHQADGDEPRQRTPDHVARGRGNRERASVARLTRPGDDAKERHGG